MKSFFNYYYFRLCGQTHHRKRSVPQRYILTVKTLLHLAHVVFPRILNKRCLTSGASGRVLLHFAGIKRCYSPLRSPSPTRTPSQPGWAVAQTCCFHTYTVGGAAGHKQGRALAALWSFKESSTNRRKHKKKTSVVHPSDSIDETRSFSVYELIDPAFYFSCRHPNLRTIPLAHLRTNSPLQWSQPLMTHDTQHVRFIVAPEADAYYPNWSGT